MKKEIEKLIKSNFGCSACDYEPCAEALAERLTPQILSILKERLLEKIDFTFANTPGMYTLERLKEDIKLIIKNEI